MTSIQYPVRVALALGAAVFVVGIPGRASSHSHVWSHSDKVWTHSDKIYYGKDNVSFISTPVYQTSSTKDDKTDTCKKDCTPPFVPNPVTSVPDPGPPTVTPPGPGVAVPGPLAGAGLPALLGLAAMWFVRRRGSRDAVAAA